MLLHNLASPHVLLLLQSLHPLMPLLQPYSDARMRGVIAAALLIAFGVFGSLAVGSCLAFGPNLEVGWGQYWLWTSVQSKPAVFVCILPMTSVCGSVLVSPARTAVCQ